MYLYLLLVETKGRTLEEMDEIFGGQAAVHDAQIMNEVQNRINQNHPTAISARKTEAV